MHKSKRFWVSCKALGVPETKEASVRAANEWWTKNQAEIDAAGKPPPRVPLPMEDIAAAALGQSPDAFFEKLLDYWRSSTDAGTIRPGDVHERAERDLKGIIANAVNDVLGKSIEGKPLPPEIAERLPPARFHQVADAVKGLRGESAADPERTVRAQADGWLAHQAALVKAGQMSAARCANNRTCLDHLVTFVGPDADATSLDAPRLQVFYLWCLGKVSARRQDTRARWSIAFARDVFSVAKAFIRWAWEQGAVELPKNIASKSFRFGSPAKAVKTWTPAEFQTVVAASPGKLKLALLLMANCGMTQVDISDLRDDEVDWIEGRIIRRRSKTANCENVPTVNYKLWPYTFQMLQEYRDGGERVLLTESGKPYVRTELVNGKLRKADGFASNFVHVKKRLKMRLSLKSLRKLGATLLDGHKDYGRFKSYFLGHSPRTVADKHYAAPSRELFDEAVLWLGRQLGQC